MWILPYYPIRKKKDLPPSLVIAQPMKDCHNLANEKSLYVQLLTYFSGLFVYDSQSNFPVFLYKRAFSFAQRDLSVVLQ